MKQDKEEIVVDKELMELAQALEDQLPDELLPPPTPVTCPLHPTKSLKEFVSKMGDEFVKCSPSRRISCLLRRKKAGGVCTSNLLWSAP